MKYIHRNLAHILILLALFSMISCSNEESCISDGEIGKDALLNLSIKTGLADDPLVKDGDGSFSSLALFVFNKTTGQCEYSEVIPSFTPQALHEFKKSVNISVQTKVIYAIANFNDAHKTFSKAITTGLTMAQIEAMTVNNVDFTSTNILMIGKKELSITSKFLAVEIPMERLVSRLDIYMFKSGDFEGQNLEVESVELVNDVLNSQCSYKSTAMVTPIHKTNVSRIITTNKTLAVAPTDLSGIQPANAHASFYSYQNTASSSVPDDAITPHLKITLKVDGNTYIGKGYIADSEHASSKYNLLRNTVYRVIVNFSTNNTKSSFDAKPDAMLSDIIICNTEVSSAPYGGLYTIE